MAKVKEQHLGMMRDLQQNNLAEIEEVDEEDSPAHLLNKDQEKKNGTRPLDLSASLQRSLSKSQ